MTTRRRGQDRAADFNCDLDILDKSTFARSLGWTIIAPRRTKPTCVTDTPKSVIDYFVLTDGLISAADIIDVIMSSYVATHRPVQLRFEDAIAELCIRQLSKLQKIPIQRKIGLEGLAEDYTRVASILDLARCFATHRPRMAAITLMDHAYGILADKIEKELVRNTECEQKKKG